MFWNWGKKIQLTIEDVALIFGVPIEEDDFILKVSRWTKVPSKKEESKEKSEKEEEDQKNEEDYFD